MKTALKVFIIITLVFGSSILYFYTQFQVEVEANSQALDENINIFFQTTTEKDKEIIDLDLQRYSDITFLDLIINVQNRGENKTLLRKPVLHFYLEDVLIQNKSYDDMLLNAGETRPIPSGGLSFSSGSIDEALKGRTQRPEEILAMTANASFEYDYKVRGYTFRTYRLGKVFEGSIPFREIFGGKTQEEAVDDIIAILNKTI